MSQQSTGLSHDERNGVQLTGPSSGNQLSPLAVSPRKACLLLDCGTTHLYKLLRDGELESYLDGRARRITMRSIHRRITRLLANAGATGTATEDMPRPRHPGRKANHEKRAGACKTTGKQTGPG